MFVITLGVGTVFREKLEKKELLFAKTGRNQMLAQNISRKVSESDISLRKGNLILGCETGPDMCINWIK